MGQVQAQDGVARLQQGEHGGGVGLGAGVRLHVGVLGAEQGLDPVDGQLLDHVDVLAAAVVALARVALGVLVGQHRALRLHDGERGEVLATRSSPGCDCWRPSSASMAAATSGSSCASGASSSPWRGRGVRSWSRPFERRVVHRECNTVAFVSTTLKDPLIPVTPRTADPTPIIRLPVASQNAHGCTKGTRTMNLERLKDIHNGEKVQLTFSEAEFERRLSGLRRHHGGRRPRRRCPHELSLHQLLLGLPVHLLSAVPTPWW